MMKDAIVTDVEELIAGFNMMKSLAGEQKEIYAYLRSVIIKACAAVPGVVTVTDILCREYIDGYPCGGRISVLKTDVPGRITWTCCSCSRKGVLINWHCIDDIDVPIEDEDRNTNRQQVIYRLILSKDEFTALSSVGNLDLDSQLLVRSAIMTSSGIMVYGSMNDMELVLAGLDRSCGVSPGRIHSAIRNKLQEIIEGCSE
jgi:hypothetical protein